MLPVMAGREPNDLATARAQMVDRQLRGRGIADERVLDAMGAVPREHFVASGLRRRAYDDAALPIALGQSISQPYVVARMIELLAPEPGQRVLDIGTGSGYGAAVLAAMGCLVVSIERHGGLADEARGNLERAGWAERVEIRVGDGTLGDAAGAPWPRIVVGAAAPHIPDPLREQLDPDGGRLVLPVGSHFDQRLVLVVRDGAEWVERDDGSVVFVPLIGEQGYRYD
jgi:protein-L-isoaspartate(D-aspartate) O-methyltransferase